jgi:hypothetical protein
MGFSRGEVASSVESELSGWSVESLTDGNENGMVGRFSENGSVFPAIFNSARLRR